MSHSLEPGALVILLAADLHSAADHVLVIFQEPQKHETGCSVFSQQASQSEAFIATKLSTFKRSTRVLEMTAVAVVLGVHLYVKLQVVAASSS